MRETGPQATSILADVRILLSERAGGAAARDQVYVALREAIVSAELEPGRKLSENELAELLGVSRTPVREALARLRDDRLVAIVPQLGTFVTLISRRGDRRRRVRARGARVQRHPARHRARHASAARGAAGQPRRPGARRAAGRHRRVRRARRGAPPHPLRAERPRHRLVAQPARERPSRSRAAIEPARTRISRRDGRPSTAPSWPPWPTATPSGPRQTLRHHLRMVLSSLPQHPRCPPRLLRGELEMAVARATEEDDASRRRTPAPLRGDGAEPRLRDRGRAPVQGGEDRWLLPPLVGPGGHDRRRRCTRSSRTTCS